MELIKEYWFIISGVIFPIISYFVGKYKSKIKSQEIRFKEHEQNLTLLKEGMCALQRNYLLKACEDYRKRGWCSMEAKKTLTELYESYHKLGGNSFITSMVKSVNQLPEEKKMKEVKE